MSAGGMAWIRWQKIMSGRDLQLLGRRVDAKFPLLDCACQPCNWDPVETPAMSKVHHDANHGRGNPSHDGQVMHWEG